MRAVARLPVQVKVPGPPSPAQAASLVTPPSVPPSEAPVEPSGAPPSPVVASVPPSLTTVAASIAAPSVWPCGADGVLLPKQPTSAEVAIATAGLRPELVIRTTYRHRARVSTRARSSVRVWFAAHVERPRDEHGLQGQTRPEQPRRNAVAGARIDDHVDVGGEHSDVQKDEANAGRAARARDQKAHAPEDLEDAAHQDERQGRG